MLPRLRLGSLSKPMDHGEVHAMLLDAQDQSPGASEDSVRVFQYLLGPIEGSSPHSHQSMIFVFLPRATENLLRMNLVHISCDRKRGGMAREVLGLTNCLEALLKLRC